MPKVDICLIGNFPRLHKNVSPRQKVFYGVAFVGQVGRNGVTFSSQKSVESPWMASNKWGESELDMQFVYVSQHCRCIHYVLNLLVRMWILETDRNLFLKKYSAEYLTEYSAETEYVVTSLHYWVGTIRYSAILLFAE